MAVDFAGTLDLDPSLREVRGRVALAEAVFRRLTTPNGSLPDFPDYGYDVTELIGTSFNQSQVQQQVETQVLLEEEVDDVAAEVVLEDETVIISVAIDDGNGPFDLTISVDELETSYVIGE